MYTIAVTERLYKMRPQVDKIASEKYLGTALLSMNNVFIVKWIFFAAILLL